MSERKTCSMVIVETADLTYLWQCTECQVMHKASRKMEARKTCPTCGRTITCWVGVDDVYDDD